MVGLVSLEGKVDVKVNWSAGIVLLRADIGVV